MDSTRRDQLAARRHLAQLRLVRARVSGTYRAIALLLCAHAARFARLPPAACTAALQGLADGPGQDNRLLWDHVPDATCLPWADAVERDALITRALCELTAPGTRIAVIWDPFQSGLLIRCHHLIPVMTTLFDHLFGTVWLVAADGGRWLIEVSFSDHDVCWAPVMAGCG